LFLPVSLAALRLFTYPPAAAPVYCLARLAQSSSPDVVLGDLLLFDADGTVVAAAQGLQLRAASAAPRPAEDQTLRRWFYHLAWEPAPLDLPVAAPRRTLAVVFAARRWPSSGSWFRRRWPPCPVSPAATFARLDATHYQLTATSLVTSANYWRRWSADHAPAGIVYGWGWRLTPIQLPLPGRLPSARSIWRRR
jgi:hypothetical protein